MKPILSLLAVSLALLAGESAAAGHVSSMSMQPATVSGKGVAKLKFVGIGACSYGIKIVDSNGRVHDESPRYPGTAASMWTLDFSRQGGTPPGQYKLSFVNGNSNNGDLCDLPVPEPIQFVVLPPPQRLSSDMIMIRSMESGDALKNAKQPFPAGKIEFSLSTLKPPGCKVRVSVQGSAYNASEIMILNPVGTPYPGSLGVAKSGPSASYAGLTPGMYTLTLNTADYTPEELKCEGLPISKSFEVVPKPFSSTTPGMSQPFNPITPPNPLIKLDAGKARP